MMHLEDPLQQPVVDGSGGADGSVGEEEGPDGCEDCVGHGNATVDRQVESDIGAGLDRSEGGGGREGGRRRRPVQAR